jgi:predicted CoA-binding protein
MPGAVWLRIRAWPKITDRGRFGQIGEVAGKTRPQGCREAGVFAATNAPESAVGVDYAHSVMTEHEQIEDFLAQHRIAFVGLSSDDKDFSHAVYKEMKERGYELVPVHPTAERLEDQPVYAKVADIEGQIDGALLMVPAAASAELVDQCADAGIPRVWLHRGVGPGAVSDEAIARAKERGLALVAGQCPLMFLRDAAWFHRLHAWGKKVAGTYPR